MANGHVCFIAYYVSTLLEEHIIVCSSSTPILSVHRHIKIGPAFLIVEKTTDLDASHWQTLSHNVV